MASSSIEIWMAKYSIISISAARHLDMGYAQPSLRANIYVVVHSIQLKFAAYIVCSEYFSRRQNLCRGYARRGYGSPAKIEKITQSQKSYRIWRALGKTISKLMAPGEQVFWRAVLSIELPSFVLPAALVSEIQPYKYGSGLSRKSAKSKNSNAS